MTHRIRITTEDGTLLHEGPVACTDYERACDEVVSEEESHRVHIDTPWGRGWYDDRRPQRIFVPGMRTRPVA